MKITKLFFLLSIAYYVAAAKPKAENYDKGVRFKSIKCSADNKTAILKVCSLKAYSRVVVGLNVGIDFPKPLEQPFYAQVLVKLRTGQNYHTVVDTKPVEWCSVMNGNVGHLFVQHIISQIRSTAPTLFHKCPYNRVDIKNVTIDTTGIDETKWLPAGDQRIDILAWKNGKVIVSVNVTVETKHSRDQSFTFDAFNKKFV
jgi:hypothetical protein